ncbi:MAG: hypothetical protein ACYC40_01710 [Patescibacteria group bacterium]
MKQQSEFRKRFVIVVVAVYAFFFSLTATIPIIGPSIVAYVVGTKKYKNRINELSKIHFLVSFAISELVLLIASYPIYYILSGFYDPKGYWHIIAIALIINLLSAIIFFYLGDYHAKKKRKWGLIDPQRIY